MKPAETLVLSRNAGIIAPAPSANRVMRNTYWPMSQMPLFSAGAAALTAALQRLKAAREFSRLLWPMPASGISGGMDLDPNTCSPGIPDRMSASARCARNVSESTAPTRARRPVLRGRAGAATDSCSRR